MCQQFYKLVYTKNFFGDLKIALTPYTRISLQIAGPLRSKKRFSPCSAECNRRWRELTLTESLPTSRTIYGLVREFCHGIHRVKSGGCALYPYRDLVSGRGS